VRRLGSLPLTVPTGTTRPEEPRVYPDDLKYTAEHEWVRTPGESEGSVRVGITQFAQDALGDIVYVSLPEVGDTVEAGAPCGELESTKSVSDIFAPVTGEVVARNESLDATPELVNSDPYGGGWLFELAPAEADDVDGLLDATAYQAGIDS
jgi:glycine cleavage system H protein